MSESKMAAIFLFIVAVLAIFVGAPLAIIWALNTLFSIGIEYSFWTWLAALVLGGLVGQSAAR